jgi:uncharacterized protein (TIGR00725 family)
MPKIRAGSSRRCIPIKRKVGVVGSAGGDITEEALKLARELGREIARRDCIVVTGACPGLPQAAVLGARELGAMSVGISPALCLDQHRFTYHSPWEEYDVIVFTGSGLMGREVDVVRTADVVIVVGGRSGTLGEFSIAYDDGNIIGVLQGTGGIADHMEQIVSLIQKDTGSEIVYSGNPKELLDRCFEVHARWESEGRAYSINEFRRAQE